MRNQVTADASIVAELGPGGATRLPVLRSQAPLVLRRTPEAVYLVGAAAGPIAGDRLNLGIVVGPGAFLRVRTSAACVALPGPGDAESVFAVTVDIGPGGRLEYLPEPTVIATGARHATEFRVALAAGAALLLRDELILGRHGEAGGRARGVLSVDYAGRPLLRQALDVGGDDKSDDKASRGPAVLAGHRAVGTLLYAGAMRAGTEDAGAGDDTGTGWATPKPADARPRDAMRAGTGDDTETGPATPKPADAKPGDTVLRDPGTRDPGLTDTGPNGTGLAGAGVAVMGLAGPGVLVTALADDAVTLRRRLSVSVGTNSAGEML